MGIGLQIRKVTFEEFTPVITATGGREDNWTPFTVTNGELIFSTSGRALEDGQNIIASSWILRIYWYQDLANKIGQRIRAVIDGEIYIVDSYELVQHKKHFFNITLLKSQIG